MVKTIHYVWLGGRPLPKNVKSIINSWKKYCPDWTIIEHNESNFDVNKYRWVKEALEMKQYAFAADFIRLDVLYNQGGLYMDTDVQLYKPIDSYIDSSFITGMMNHRAKSEYESKITEDGIDTDTGEKTDWFGLQVGFIYSEPHHPFVADCISNLYEFGQKQFKNDDGTHNAFVIEMPIAYELLKYGFKYRDFTQLLKSDIKIYDTTILSTRLTKTKNTIAIHWFDQTWIPNIIISMKIKAFVKRYLYFIYRSI